MSQYYFTTQQLTVGYDGVPLIRDITINIERGEIVTLIGPNGSGKSTILKSITRQLRMIGGKVFIASQELRKLSYRDLSTRMAVVLTDRMKPELMTCRDIVATGRYPYTGRLGILSPEDEAKVEDAMTAVHALELRNRDFNAISDGQRQRVLLARALCQEPKILILDEPTSFLDLRHKLDFLQLLRDLVREKQLAVIMSMHELELAQRFSDTLLCIRNGRIDRAGTPEEVFTPGYIETLYDMDQGSYDCLAGTAEAGRLPDPPKVFVIGGGGSGIPVYRKLRRLGIPFAVGVLQENDLDLPTARALAGIVITDRAYEKISREKVEEALAVLNQCEELICTVGFGEENRENHRLLERGIALGIAR